MMRNRVAIELNVQRQLLLMLAVIFTLSLLAGCGYQLRGSASLPPVMSTTYVKGLRPYSALVDDFSQALRTRNATVTTDPEIASATLSITANDTEKLVLSVDTAGNVLEYEIRQTIRFSVVAADQQVLLSEQTVSLSRDFLFTSTDVLAKAREEKLVRRTLQKNIVNLAMLRIAALGR
jgi:LPS-assembly lipoprotein